MPVALPSEQREHGSRQRCLAGTGLQPKAGKQQHRAEVTTDFPSALPLGSCTNCCIAVPFGKHCKVRKSTFSLCCKSKVFVTLAIKICNPYVNQV